MNASAARAGGADSPSPDVEDAALPPQAPTPSPRPSQVALVVLVVGLIVTAALAVAALGIYNRNEDRLLRLRVHELSLVLTGALPASETPLASAAALADATAGNPTKFRSFIKDYTREGRQFASVSLWPLGRPALKPSVVVGSSPQLAALPAQARQVFAKAEHSSQLSLTGILGSANPSLGYAFSVPGVKNGFAVYAENPLPKSRRSQLAASSGFSDLDYAIYLGRGQSAAQLLVTNLGSLPVRGRTATQIVPFGDSAFTLVVTPNTSLGGTFFEDLPWIIGVIGTILALAAALMTDRLARRRRQAEQLAGVLDRVAEQNREMYAEQRTIAQSLQHALLPETLPEFGGLETSARYVPATSGIDVGGDWYDVIAIDEGSVLLLVGDVSGHGLRAATTMASLRYAALAYAAQDPRPAVLLERLSDFANSQQHEYFATVLCCRVDVEDHTVTLASAGHMAPLVLDDSGGRFLEVDAGVPIGVARETPYAAVTATVAPRSTLLAFTDGLVERRGETLDAGLARLQRVAMSEPLTLEGLVAKLVRELPPDGHNDDTAILAIRWRS
jgi:serine phosphatase RsbU (regulator of sigma subunit)